MKPPARPAAPKANVAAAPRGLSRTEKERRIRLGAYGGGAVLIAVLAFAIFYHSPTDCTSTPERERAMQAVVSSKDPVTGESLDDRFDPDELICRDTQQPKGVVISAQEASGETIVWFVDANGGGHNVNLLAQAFTPAFTAAPALPPEATQEMRKRR